MKSAFKGIQSKFKDRRSDEGNGHMSRHQNHHTFDPSDLPHAEHSTAYSAPNSPVFTHSNLNATQSPEFLTMETSPSYHNPHTKHNYRSSIQNMQPTPTNHQTINHNHIVKTKKIGCASATSIGQSSSSSSNSSSSEMNLLQELQQHALFRTPVPYRSVSSTIKFSNFKRGRTFFWYF